MAGSIIDSNQCIAIEENKRCDNITSIVGPYCSYHLKKLKGLEVKKSNISGQGLFATRNIKKGEKIDDYMGDILYKIDQDNISDYILKVTNNYYIDAKRTNSCGARYANDYRNSGKRPNAYLKANRISKRAWLQAIRNIEPGEEILTNYGKDFWKNK